MMTDAERRRLELSPAGLPEVLARLEASTSGKLQAPPLRVGHHQSASQIARSRAPAPSS